MIWIWLLLSAPIDRTICTVWVSSPPTVAVLRQACPWPLQDIDLLVWRGVDRMTGEIICERPASELPDLKCDLFPIGDYNLVIIQPNYREWICTVHTLTSSMPTDDQITAACPDGTLQRYRLGSVIVITGGTKEPEVEPGITCQMPAVETGPYLLQSPPDPAGLYTAEPLSLLAGRLLWWGIASPDCNSWSGIDPVTGGATACGMSSSWTSLIEWQNQFNDVIWASAQDVGIPAGLLKRIIMVESQFWPLWMPEYGERGLIQLTETGADTALQYSSRLYDYYCPFAIDPSRCSQWGTTMPDERTAITVVLMNDLSCYHCTPATAARHARETMIINAEIIKAFYCHAASVTGSPSWESTLIDFNAGQSCLVSSCQAGRDYVAEVMR